MQVFLTLLAAVMCLVSTRRIVLHSSDTKHNEATQNGEGERELTALPEAATNAADNWYQVPDVEGATSPTLQVSEYVMSSLNANVCAQGYQPIADAALCRAVGDALGFVYMASGSWPDDPGGCHQRLAVPGLSPPIYFNTHAGSANPDYRVICMAVPDYVVSSLNTDVCPQGYQPILDASWCRAAANTLGLKYRISSSWAGDPRGCHKRAVDDPHVEKSVWYNTHIGRANPNFTVVCTKASPYLLLSEFPNAACHDSGRVPGIWVWGCTGTCGPNWGDLAKCKSLCDHIGQYCTHFTYFSDGGCGIYSECSATVNPSEVVNADTYSKVELDKVEVKYLGFSKSDRVRVVMEVNGKARNRWQQLKRKPSSEVGTNFIHLSEKDFGTVNSISSISHLEVGVIFDEDVKTEVWVDPDYLIKDDLPIKEADNDTLIEEVLKSFPRLEDMAIFKCPITEKIIRVPVVASDGRTYEKSAMEEASRGSEPSVANFELNSLLKALTEKVVARDSLASMEELAYQVLGENPPALGAENVASFKCPLSLEFLRDPVVASDGHTYERGSIQRVLGINAISPITREPLTLDLFPNRAMKSLLSAVIHEADLMQKAVGNTSGPFAGSTVAGQSAAGFCQGGDGEHSTFLNGGITPYTKSYCEAYCNTFTRVQYQGTRYCCVMSNWGNSVACTLRYGILNVVYDGVFVWAVDPPDADDDW